MEEWLQLLKVGMNVVAGGGLVFDVVEAGLQPGDDQVKAEALGLRQRQRYAVIVEGKVGRGRAEHDALSRLPLLGAEPGWAAVGAMRERAVFLRDPPQLLQEPGQPLR